MFQESHYFIGSVASESPFLSVSDGSERRQPEAEEILEDERFLCERYKGSRVLSDHIIADIGSVYSSVFGQRLSDHYGSKNVELFISDDIKRIKDYVSREDTHVVLLREKQNQNVVGFSYSLPYRELPRTVEFALTAILEEFRGKGGWSLMMQGMEDGIATEKKYKRMITTATTVGEFDEKFKKRYRGRVISEQDIFSSHGHHRRITVRLGKNPLRRLLVWPRS